MSGAVFRSVSASLNEGLLSEEQRPFPRAPEYESLTKPQRRAALRGAATEAAMRNAANFGGLNEGLLSEEQRQRTQDPDRGSVAASTKGCSQRSSDPPLRRRRRTRNDASTKGCSQRSSDTYSRTPALLKCRPQRRAALRGAATPSH